MLEECVFYINIQYLEVIYYSYLWKENQSFCASRIESGFFKNPDDDNK